MADVVTVTPGGFSYSSINFDEPKPWSNYSAVLMGLTVTFSTISWCSAVGRLYTRFKVLKCAGIDDYLVVVYLISTSVGAASICLSVEHGGLGEHLLLLTKAQKIFYIKSYYVGNIVYNLSATSIKLALLFQYIRIYRRGTHMYRTCIAAIIIVAAWGILYIVLAAVPCFPISDFFTKPPIARCWGYGSRDITQFVATYISHTTVNVFIELIVMVIPIPLVFNKETGPAQRWRLIGMISMGGIVIILAIWRLQTIIEHRVATWPTRDPTWYSPITILLANLEVDAAAVCASVPIFWPVLTNTWVGRIFVTHEVCVTSETRIVPYEEEDQSRHEQDSSRQTGNISRVCSQHSTKRSGSSISTGREEGRGRDLEAHYQDSYILQQVDPLKISGHRAEATSNGPCTKDPTKGKGDCPKTGGWMSLK